MQVAVNRLNNCIGFPLIMHFSFIHSFRLFLQHLFKSTTTQRRSRHCTDTVSEFHAEAPQATASEGLNPRSLPGSQSRSQTHDPSDERRGYGIVLRLMPRIEMKFYISIYPLLTDVFPSTISSAGQSIELNVCKNSEYRLILGLIRNSQVVLFNLHKLQNPNFWFL